MSEIVQMNQKLNEMISVLGINQKPGERVCFEMMMTFAYTEGFKDGYARAFAESFCESNENGGQR